MATTEPDPDTPVIIGVGQASERLGDPDYRALSPVGLASLACERALEDTGADPTAAATAVDTVAGIRQFEISVPGATAPLGRSDNYPRSVAARIGARPERAILEVVGGQGPQHLVTELAADIAHGRCRAALVFGSEAISTVQAMAGAENRPDFSERVGGSLEDRGLGLDGLLSHSQLVHGLADMPSQYALFDNARRARLGHTREEYAAGMGELFAPFTRVAAANPHAAAPTERSADELVTPTDRNRPIADPYTRYIVSRDKVNQGAAVLLVSATLARELGVGRERWVFLHGHADLVERGLMERADLSRSPAAVMATEHALEVAGIHTADLATIDLYSCFPIAVSNIADALGLTADDPRGLTVTGGLPFFGGAGNNYSMHAIAETVHSARATPGGYGLVGANGGALSKYSVGVYSTAPAGWRPNRSAELQHEIDAWEAPGEAVEAHGWATVETYTVRHGSAGARTGVVIGRLDADGRRFLANTEPDDQETLRLLSRGEPIGAAVFARSTESGNRVATTPERMAELPNGR